MIKNINYYKNNKKNWIFLIIYKHKYILQNKIKQNNKMRKKENIKKL